MALPALAIGVPAALGAHALRGKTYSGSIKRVVGGQVAYTDEISFKVSASGKKVGAFSLPNGYPVYCEGGGFGTVQKASAKVSKKGTFTAKLPIYFAPEHSHQGFVLVSGEFGKKGHESGTVKTDFTSSPTCNGTSKYSTKASG